MNWSSTEKVWPLTVKGRLIGSWETVRRRPDHNRHRPTDHETPEAHSTTRLAEQEMFDALVLGVRDYFRKTGFEHALHWVERRYRLITRGGNRRHSAR